MTLRRKVLVSLLALIGLAAVSLAVAVSYTSACPEPEALPEGTQRMQAVMARCYGSPEVLKLEIVAKPTPADDEILVKVHAAAVNPLDWHYMRGEPYIMRLSAGFGAPSDATVGVDFAGTVEAAGKAVQQFKVGDEVFGGRGGALAQYLVVRESRAVVLKPANLTFDQAAAMPIAAVTALQGLRDKGRLQPGQKVLINGASGGVGTFAVQIAKSLGAEVTGVCSTRNVELVRSLGADHVIDYKKQNFTEGTERYDLILDNVGNHPFLDYRRVLEPGGTVVIVGGPSDDPWLGPMIQVIKSAFLSPFVGEKFLKFFADLNQADLTLLADLARDGKLRSVIDRRYALKDAASAIEYLETGRARGKVIVLVSDAP